MTLEQIRTFWTSCGTASTIDLYVGEPQAIYDAARNMNAEGRPLFAGVKLMLEQAPECEML